MSEPTKTQGDSHALPCLDVLVITWNGSPREVFLSQTLGFERLRELNNTLSSWEKTAGTYSHVQVKFNPNSTGELKQLDEFIWKERSGHNFNDLMVVVETDTTTLLNNEAIAYSGIMPPLPQSADSKSYESISIKELLLRVERQAKQDQWHGQKIS